MATVRVNVHLGTYLVLKQAVVIPEAVLHRDYAVIGTEQENGRRGIRINLVFK